MASHFASDSRRDDVSDNEPVDAGAGTAGDAPERVDEPSAAHPDDRESRDGGVSASVEGPDGPAAPERPFIGSYLADSIEPPVKKKRIWPLVVLLIVLLAVAAGGISFLVYYHGKEAEAAATVAGELAPATPQDAAVDEETQLAENPIDFATLKSENSDIFAWLYIPGCEINTPLFQSPTDDLYYLWRNKDKVEDLYGVPFIQLCNSDDLNDPVTVVYGHRNDGAFKPLLQYQNKEFFDANLEFYVYVPGHIYTYTVVSSYIYDTRHIMNSFNFSDQSVVDAYFDFVASPDSISSNVNSGVALSSDSKLLQLSTCSTTHQESDGRFIVSAVRTGDQPTY